MPVFAGLSFFALVLLTSWLVGNRVVGMLVTQDRGTPAERCGFGLLIGVGVLASLGFLLALARWFTPLTLAVVVSIGVLWALDNPLRRRQFAADLGLLFRRPWGFVWVAIVPTVALALYPATGFDEGVYHLPLAQYYAESAAVDFVAELRVPVYPVLGEIGFAAALATVGEVGARLTQTVSLIAVAALLLAWGQRWNNSTIGILAAALWLGLPLAIRVGTMAYVDVSLAGFVAASLFALERAWLRRDRGWFALAGLAAGFAVATKHLGWIAAAGVGGVAILAAWRERRVAVAAAPLIGLTLGAGPTIWHLVATTGNPLFPYLSSIFGTSLWADIPINTALGAPGGAAWLLDAVLFLALVPWNGVFARDLLGFQAPLSPLWIILIPTAIPLALRTTLRRVVTANLGVVLGWGVLWLATPLDPRYLLPIAPSLCLVLATGLASAVGDRWRRSLVVACVLPSIGFLAITLARLGPPPLNEADSQQFKERTLPGFAVLAQAPPGQRVYGLSAEHLIYHARGLLIGDAAGPYAQRLVFEVAHHPPALSQRLRGFGTDYLLVRNVALSPELEASLAACFEERARDRLYSLWRATCPAEPVPQHRWRLFADGFESGDLVPWSTTITP